MYAKAPTAGCGTVGRFRTVFATGEKTVITVRDGGRIRDCDGDGDEKLTMLYEMIGVVRCSTLFYCAIAVGVAIPFANTTRRSVQDVSLK